ETPIASIGIRIGESYVRVLGHEVAIRVEPHARGWGESCCRVMPLAVIEAGRGEDIMTEIVEHVEVDRAIGVQSQKAIAGPAGRQGAVPELDEVTSYCGGGPEPGTQGEGLWGSDLLGGADEIVSIQLQGAAERCLGARNRKPGGERFGRIPERLLHDVSGEKFEITGTGPEAEEFLNRGGYGRWHAVG